MNTTIVLAQILGIIFTVSGLSILANRKGMASLFADPAHNHGLVWLYGFVILTFGAVLLAFNSTWTSGLVSLITFIAWLCIVKGIALLCCPTWVVTMYRKWCNTGLLLVSGLVAFALGLVLLYKGLM